MWAWEAMSLRHLGPCTLISLLSLSWGRSLPALPLLSPSPLSHKDCRFTFHSHVSPGLHSLHLLNPSALSGFFSVFFSELLADFSLLFPTRNRLIKSNSLLSFMPLPFCPLPQHSSVHRCIFLPLLRQFFRFTLLLSSLPLFRQFSTLLPSSQAFPVLISRQVT